MFPPHRNSGQNISADDNVGSFTRHLVAQRRFEAQVGPGGGSGSGRNVVIKRNRIPDDASSRDFAMVNGLTGFRIGGLDDTSSHDFAMVSDFGVGPDDTSPRVFAMVNGFGVGPDDMSSVRMTRPLVTSRW